MPLTYNPADRLQSTARIGVWLSTFVLLVLSGVIGFFLYTSLSDGDALSRLLTDQLDLNGPAPLLDILQSFTLTVLWLLTDVLAFCMLLHTRALFAGIREMGIFTLETAQRLRSIGMLLFALGPVSVLVNMGASMLLSYWRDSSGLHGSISVEDADFYAMVVGLVIVAVGHIMVDATRLDAENKAFV